MKNTSSAKNSPRSWGAQLKKERLRAGMGQTMLGALLGCTAIAVSLIERGVLIPFTDQAQMLCDLFGLDAPPQVSERVYAPRRRKGK